MNSLELPSLEQVPTVESIIPNMAWVRDINIKIKNISEQTSPNEKTGLCAITSIDALTRGQIPLQNYMQFKGGMTIPQIYELLGKYGIHTEMSSMFVPNIPGDSLSFLAVMAGITFAQALRENVESPGLLLQHPNGKHVSCLIPLTPSYVLSYDVLQQNSLVLLDQFENPVDRYITRYLKQGGNISPIGMKI